MGKKGLLSRVVESLERQLLCDALKKFQGNKTQAARYLGISRKGIDKKLHRYAISDKDLLQDSKIFGKE